MNRFLGHILHLGKGIVFLRLNRGKFGRHGDILRVAGRRIGNEGFQCRQPVVPCGRRKAFFCNEVGKVRCYHLVAEKVKGHGCNRDALLICGKSQKLVQNGSVNRNGMSTCPALNRKISEQEVPDQQEQLFILDVVLQFSHNSALGKICPMLSQSIPADFTRFSGSKWM